MGGQTVQTCNNRCYTCVKLEIIKIVDEGV